MLTGSVARRFDRVSVELGAGVVRGIDSTAVTGWVAEGRVAVRVVSAGRFRFGLGAALLGASVTGSGGMTEASTALRGEVRAELRLSRAWSVLVLGGGGRALRAPDAFVTLGLGVVAGL
jgi:hypothetical protein